MHLTQSQIHHFQQHLWNFYREQGRVFSWRLTDNPYHIVVSEVMLQQTQTQRVVTKYEEFIEAFPTWADLAAASLYDVLAAWQGLGYNRRALSLHGMAQKIVAEHRGVVLADPAFLATFKGIGPATAASICAFAFNQPTVFIETNIRTVCTHSFFRGMSGIDDKQLLPYVAAILDKNNPRLWYYALTDYGVLLKKLYPNSNKASKHYTKQSKFEGSDRQIRGAIIRLLIQCVTIASDELMTILDEDQDRVAKILDQLEKEGFLYRSSSGKIELKSL